MDASDSLCFDATSLAHRDVRGEQHPHPPHLRFDFAVSWACRMVLPNTVCRSSIINVSAQLAYGYSASFSDLPESRGKEDRQQQRRVFDSFDPVRNTPFKMEPLVT